MSSVEDQAQLDFRDAFMGRLQVARKALEDLEALVKDSTQQPAAAEEPVYSMVSLINLNWCPARGKGEIIYTKDVPEWVGRLPGLKSDKGVEYRDRTYKLFQSGILWRSD